MSMAFGKVLSENPPNSWNGLNRVEDNKHVPNLRVKSIEIVLEDTSEEQCDNVILVYKDNAWRSSGPFYPRHVALMEELNKMILDEKHRR